MKRLFKQLVVAGNFGTPASDKLYNEACKWIGTDASPQDKAPDEYGCVESFENVHHKTFGYNVGGKLSTIKLFFAIDNDPTFVRVKNPIKGDAILAVTTQGNGKISNGHVGIVGDNNTIMSNNSKTGKWDVHLTIESWNLRYNIVGGYPTYYYRKVFIS
jgi:hypothetical protein